MFSPEGFVEESIAALRNEVDDIAVIACSGGVDSTVAASIANIAIGKSPRNLLSPKRRIRGPAVRLHEYHQGRGPGFRG